jgi:predicted amidohydrolase YtcJ
MTKHAPPRSILLLVSLITPLLTVLFAVPPARGQAAIQPTPLPAELGDGVYVNANIHTADPDRPRAASFAVSRGEIVAVGSEREVIEAIDPMGLADILRIDLGGRTVLPGLIDAHCHLAGLGALHVGVIDLAGTTSYEQVIERVAARAAETPKGEWVLGHGWDNESWDNPEDRKALPTHDALSEAVPDHPVWIARVDGHAALANRAAMDAADISPETKSPEGGEVLRRDDGALTGVFVDNAESLIERAIPAGARGDPESMIRAAQRACLSAGLTGVHDMGVHPATAELYRDLSERGILKLRVHAACPSAFAIKHFEQNPPYRSERFSFAGAKAYIDGAMGSRGAWLLAPYADRPAYTEGDRAGEPYTGLSVQEPAFIEALARHGLEKGYQVFTHAIGDRGNREVLDAYERAAKSTGHDLSAARFRVEHAQLLSPADIPRFATLGVIASMQPTHCTSDMRWVEDRVGEQRAAGAYAWASLLRTGAVIAGGSDFPVESHNPFLGIYAAVTRQNAEGSPERGWRPEERMTRTEALRSMTIDAAHSAFMDSFTGSITPGKRADFIVIDRDIMTCDPSEILGTRVLRTVIDGEQVYSSDG